MPSHSILAVGVHRVKEIKDLLPFDVLVLPFPIYSWETIHNPLLQVSGTRVC